MGNFDKWSISLPKPLGTAATKLAHKEKAGPGAN